LQLYVVLLAPAQCLAGNIVYRVLSGTLNPTIPYRICLLHVHAGK